jgi:hypothetical protein
VEDIGVFQDVGPSGIRSFFGLSEHFTPPALHKYPVENAALKQKLRQMHTVSRLIANDKSKQGQKCNPKDDCERGKQPTYGFATEVRTKNGKYEQ